MSVESTDLVELQSIILPKLDICTSKELFIRLDEKSVIDYELKEIELQRGSVASFDTYFNSFSINKWKNYTWVKNISLKLTLKGKFRVKLLSKDFALKTEVLISEKTIHTQELEETILFEEIDLQQVKGLLYFKLEALGNKCVFQSGSFFTLIAQEQHSDVRLAVIICTYKRENYIYRNVQRLEEYLLNHAESNLFEVFIIDNGKTLEKFSTSSKIHLVPNKNAGGSGGYARGVLETLERQDDFSHAVFVDDDVILEPQVFERLCSFLGVVRDRSLCVGGSMIKQDSKYIQHENGAIWDDGKVTPMKHNLDLREVENVLWNEVEEYANYNGWWFYCFPVSDRTLPYPFFIKLDDTEMAIRLKQKVVTLNGVCIWHEPLENKYSSSLNYYFRRNELILNTIYAEEFGRLSAIILILKFVLREAFCYKYKSADVSIEAASDFLKGPEYLSELDPEIKHVEVSGLGEKVKQNIEAPFIHEKYVESIEQAENTIHRFIRLVTLNGHLLPSALMHSAKKLSGKGYKICPIHGYRPVNTFRAQKILYYNLNVQEGFLVEFNRMKFFKVCATATSLCIALFFQFPQLKKRYQETVPKLTSPAFWKSYLKVSQ